MSLLPERLTAVQKQLEQQLRAAVIQLDSCDSRLAEAMQYGLLNGGKRLRPLLAYAAAEALGGQPGQADSAATALEMVHSYSLIHDDLPAMDDDDLRRGKPTTHIAFDEASAILAGDALLTGAFEILLADDSLSAEQRLAMTTLLARAAGAFGMVGGQSIDLNHVGKPMSLVELEQMHRGKTGALIRASVMLGAMSVRWPLAAGQEQALTDYANAIGLAFQVQDDILDVEGDTSTLGKQAGADIALNKPTYPALLGMDAARQKALELCQQAQAALLVLQQDGGQTGLLQQIADYVIERNH
ncbi:MULTISPECIES: (2E,6E)-farnesyl diphosphate synthase [unclassified Oceanobacter]|uniref:(2E,6E)-farnesyl diphosphate synthase n=2 Tax=Gammaproteobacteria TaxID=1236 RepID=UPI0026E3B83A|nr:MULTISPECIES: farnesyl diphosphate synthase [unclassified Oceanobacter]MDO6682839.1 (2E,6E)-farnesyl diphosphate synthase [Oceanobacter sp. 5_MG-2023]MDP2505598.1 (2E,6E)-farnesyl diphosphate synthase [Oceanobacter sp. 3_MG-2023]MDP2547180.1 (2E,6E)-farnesyl diphosphate synthase [Oceanobacter sp. 4_MG-2023]MDP2609401.1 (2E,6E)-farnesyl diphosphate synthase [Oceanobacter sp. 1_MG-2023]MDP2612784.1 (2E,6E)-farnesyl diphosphate synthase [Oceanobacter sp. 2_MG-2023]